MLTRVPARLLSFVPTKKPRRLWHVAAPIVVAAATTAGCFGGGTGRAEDVGALLRRVNEVRADAGLPALAWCGTLTNAANTHATDMAGNGLQPDPHTGSDGSTFVQRAVAHNYQEFLSVGENVAWGKTGVEQVLSAWLASPAHAANILRLEFNHAGFARVGNNWVQMFGTSGTC